MRRFDDWCSLKTFLRNRATDLRNGNLEWWGNTYEVRTETEMARARLDALLLLGLVAGEQDD